MHVLFVSRKNLLENIGGDSIQLLNTQKELAKLGVKVHLAHTEEELPIEKYDMIHFFNIIRPLEIRPYLNNTVPKVCSTIYVDYSELEKNHANPIRRWLARVLGSFHFEHLKLIAREYGYHPTFSTLLEALTLFPYKTQLRRILTKMDWLLPNSESEYKRIIHDFGALEVKHTKIVNSITLQSVSPNMDYQDYIVCSGRIENLKNQYRLIQALNQIQKPAVIIGDASSNHQTYYEECRKIAQKHIKFLPNISQKELFAIFAAAKVHVLASYFETTGLVSLEAAYYGCNIVVTDKGDQGEYFENRAIFCNPDSVESIKNAIEQAYSLPYNEDYKKEIEKNYTWEKTAKQTLAVYEEILSPLKSSS